MDQEALSLLAMCTIQRETSNKVINNDTELLINKFAGICAIYVEGIHTFSDQMLMYILIFCLT